MEVFKMKDYVIKYIEQTANYLNIDINEFYNILNDEWQSKNNKINA